MAFENIQAYEVETLCGRLINVSSHDKSSECDSILMYSEEDGDGNPFQFNLRPHDARVLARALNRLADVSDGRREKKVEAT